LIKSVPQIINPLSLTENADHKAYFNRKPLPSLSSL
jgi:hypothetical protein